jgi:hypothetical protein
MDTDKIIKQKFAISSRRMSPFRVRNIRRKDIYELFAELGFTYGAEVGVKQGHNARELFRKVPNLKLLLVDPWVKYRGNSNERMERIYQGCLRLLRNRNVVYMRKSSIEAAKEIPDLSLDFVYIDGMHNFDGIMTDLIHWSPKVKKDGIISGHDYMHWSYLGIIKAVDAYTYAHNIHNYYITGSLLDTDEFPSFFWVKK